MNETDFHQNPSTIRSKIKLLIKESKEARERLLDDYVAKTTNLTEIERIQKSSLETKSIEEVALSLGFEQFLESDNQQKKGRPKKTETEKVRQISIKLSKNNLNYLREFDHPSFKKFKKIGNSRKIATIIDAHSIQMNRFERQVRMVKSLCSKIDPLLKTSDISIKSGSELDIKLKELKVVLSIMLYAPDDFHGFLSKEESLILKICHFRD